MNIGGTSLEEQNDYKEKNEVNIVNNHGKIQSPVASNPKLNLPSLKANLKLKNKIGHNR